MNEEIKRQETILHTIHRMTENFLQKSNWRNVLTSELTHLKDALEVSSIFIYKNRIENKALISEQLFHLNDNMTDTKKTSIDY